MIARNKQPSVLIASPALAAANNGNWQTASRWARLLRPDFHTRVIDRWRGEGCDVLVVLHARRGADSVAAFTAAHPSRPCIVVLTGTDVYRDIHSDESAQASIEQATRLVALQALAADQLPARARAKTSVIHQSVTRRQGVPPPGRMLRVVAVGHLRPEKDPLTLLRAAQRLARRTDICFDLIGSGLDEALASAAREAQAALPRFRWLGPRPHAETRRRIQRAHLLVNSSVMEGGAHVVIEAVRSGCAVLASRIDGNLGLLGDGHGGTFEVGDDARLAALVERARDEPPFLATLREQGEGRAPLFDPALERAELHRLIETSLRNDPP